MVVALLAVLKSGAAYLPLDPAYPRARIEQMLDHARPAALLATSGVRSLFEMTSIGRELWLDELGTEACAGAKAGKDLRLATEPNDLAYVMYTSGSTGRPKGVAMPHGPLVNLIRWQLGNFKPSAVARTTQFAPISFDVSFQEIFCTLAAGGTLLPVDEDIRRDPEQLLDLIVGERVQRVFLPVVALRYLAEAACEAKRWPRELREIIVAGEQLEITRAVARMLKSMPGCVLINQYGPTETHVVTAHRVSEVPEELPAFPPIGRPIHGVQIHLLDDQRRPVAAGATGELYIGGAALARGYLHDPERTDERFVADPAAEDSNSRLYKTGDLARIRDDGEIEFLGRADEQVKIRGFRVEPGEVAAAIERHPGVQHAVVVPVGQGSAKRLVGCFTVVHGESVPVPRLHAQLRNELPPHVVPAELRKVECFPLTPSGKIDRLALARVSEESESPRADSTEPAGSVLAWKIANLWREVLNREAVGEDENFFELGGDSLLAIQMLSIARREIASNISMQRFLESPTIAGMMQSARTEVDASTWSPLVRLKESKGASPLFFVHPGGGNVLCYLPLARAACSPRPFYAFQAAGVDGVCPPAESIEAMADEYLAEVRNVQPHGPYAVGGWSLGGIVAYEMACRLEAMGEEIALLAVVDTAMLYSMAVIDALLPRDTLPMTELLKMPFEKQVAGFRKHTAIAGLIPESANFDEAANIYRTFLANVEALLQYRPGRFSGKLSLFLGTKYAVTFMCTACPAIISR